MASLHNLILLIVLITLILPMAYADNVYSLGIIKQGDDITLKQNCVNVTYVNITSISVSGLKTIELISSSISMNLISDGYQTYIFNDSSNIGHYIVTGICDESGIVKSWSYDYEVTPSGEILSAVQVSVYIFFLLLCLTLTFFSIRLIKNNKMSESEIKGSDLYEIKKRNNFLYYMTVLKKNLWIVGAFGIYLSLFIFTALTNQLIYNLGLSDLNNMLQYVILGFAWGLIPFTIFWIAWLIIVFYKSVTETMRYQFGSIGSKK